MQPDKPDAAPANWGFMLIIFAIILGITIPLEYVIIIIVPNMIYILMMPLKNMINMSTEPVMVPKTA